MLKIAVFGFYGPDQARILPRHSEEHVSPINTGDFMRVVWEMEPPATRVGSSTPDAPCFVKLTGLVNHPVYVQSISNRMAPGISYLQCDGYIAIIDAVKILGPKTIQNALRRLADQHPRAHLIIAAGRQNEPEALSSPDLRAALGLHPDLPVYPYVPSEPKTVQRLIRRLVRYISDPNRVAPPLFEGEDIPQGETISIEPALFRAEKPAAAPPPPHIQGLGHVSVTVSDLPRALDFYRGLLGFRLLGHLDVPSSERGLTITHLDTGRGVLELFSYSKAAVDPAIPEGDNPRAGLNHLALRVNGLDAIAEQLACAGVPFTLDPTDFAGGIRIAFLTDPDGTEIELMEGDIVFTRR